MSSDLRIQRQLPTQSVIEPPTHVGKSPKNKKVTEIVQSVPLSHGKTGSKEHNYALSGKTNQQETILQIFQDVFLSDCVLPGSVREVIQSYLPEETDYILDRSLITFDKYVNLTDPHILKTYLGKKHSTPKHRAAALEIVKRTYEASIRMIATDKYGMAFPMNPEILARAMELAKGQIVMELAGATGENAILLAFSDAAKVYFNDIDPNEMARFKDLRKALPKDVNHKLEPIEGDCLQVMQKKTELVGKVGLIFCRNLIHFFNDQQQEVFFKHLYALLKPGGHVVLMANAVHRFTLQSTVFEKNPEATCFTHTQCLVTDLSRGTMPCDIIYNEFSVCSEAEVTGGSKKVYLYVCNPKTQFQWVANIDGFKSLPKELRMNVQAAYNRKKNEILSFPLGTVRTLTHHTRFYSKQTLTQLVQRFGFITEAVFVVERNGHLLKEDQIMTEGQQMGIMFKKPERIDS